MDTGLMRLIWSVVEETPAMHLQGACDRETIRLLLARIDQRVVLSAQARSQAQQYLIDRWHLIQEISFGQAM
ncbi:hypothetical protein [Leptothoe kymatousa]|uniref:Uncharacterized protein n=1 Tax=Leptothoe kymatousa TAU-MAC 1615 TaxID=2364775 RepID=A0ABS5Y5N4_9CYAN|nr:hypothetical protein [Leptothoe kymatousa]MBT9312823.1 hypothetical protein [Leptothoe kymatousa TAU-MAC 1615]